MFKPFSLCEHYFVLTNVCARVPEQSTTDFNLTAISDVLISRTQFPITETPYTF